MSNKFVWGKKAVWGHLLACPTPFLSMLVSGAAAANRYGAKPPFKTAKLSAPDC